ncbi:MAG: prepilin peptidase [Candidatus Marinimicrobia bacterium]|nr:prepilin peptidase [Candidatus Neomarinimicrobiota bacterium]|tara:strand:+ start:8369 stop:9115 length:747 start_codon:yes stop_codon:yes gene_type:complete
MYILPYFFLFIFGLIFGSFLNVIIYRIPKNISIIKPRSFCPKCKKQIPLYRNIPLLSYIIQKGKCHNCLEKISSNYFIVELIIGILWMLSFYYFNSLNETIYFNIISTLLIGIAIIDKKEFIIPLELTISSLIIIITHSLIYGNILSNLSGMIIGLGYLSIIFIITFLVTKKQTLGYGDLQLIFVLGLWISDIRILLVIFTSSLIALIIWIIISIKYGFDRNRPLPFGTFLSITSIVIYPIKMDFLIF